MSIPPTINEFCQWVFSFDKRATWPTHNEKSCIVAMYYAHHTHKPVKVWRNCVVVDTTTIDNPQWLASFIAWYDNTGGMGITLRSRSDCLRKLKEIAATSKSGESNNE